MIVAENYKRFIFITLTQFQRFTETQELGIVQKNNKKYYCIVPAMCGYYCFLERNEYQVSLLRDKPATCPGCIQWLLELGTSTPIILQ